MFVSNEKLNAQELAKIPSIGIIRKQGGQQSAQNAHVTIRKTCSSVNLIVFRFVVHYTICACCLRAIIRVDIKIAQSYATLTPFTNMQALVHNTSGVVNPDNVLHSEFERREFSIVLFKHRFMYVPT